MDAANVKKQLVEKDKNTNDTPNNVFPELHIDESAEFPPIIINTVLPDDFQAQNTLASNIPLFIKKLWKMVNDDNAEEIISWNTNGNGFIIHDQIKFVSETLPKYFKHNHLSSFVRQLNLYDFHKIQNAEKEDFQFSHPFFLREVSQLLPLIKRKPPTGRHKASTSNNSESPTEVQEVMNAVKDIKNKSDVISGELSKLRQENAALWGEMNSLRVKYSKQTKIINKLIHFLISYMQKHHNSRKNNRTVSTNNANKYLKTGPKIMELDYRYKNNPHDFWTEFDNQHRNNEHSEQEPYTVVEPELDDHAHSNENISTNMTVSSAIEELLPGSSAFNQASASSLNQTLPHIDFPGTKPSSKRPNSALQRAGGSKENLGYFIDNTQMELNTIKELLKNLSPDEMTNFYKLVNENYKNQEDDITLEVSPEPEVIESELIALAQMSPLNNAVQEQDVAAPLEINENINNLSKSLKTNKNIQNRSSPLEASENVPTSETDQNSFTVPQDELFNPDDFLNNVSVDQYFNLN